MSRNYRDNNQDNNRDRNQGRDYYRSRDKNANWKRDKNESGGRDDQGTWRNRNNDNKPWRRGPRHDNQEKIVREVANLEVPDPEFILICQNPIFKDPSKPKFTVKIVKSATPPEKTPTRADELKNKITPIQKIWTSIIKQYLNDSEFVQIYRKGKSLAYGEIQYGKSIINYDEGDKSMYYQNQTSQSKIFSRAYFKLWEILQMGVFDGKEKESLSVASVAEGPGGFIHALIDYRLKKSNQKDKFYAITLKISEDTRNAKDWSDYRSKSHFDSMRSLGYKIKLSYGQTSTGDLLKQENIDFFAQHDLEGKKCYLVTGDGGIECIGDKEFDYQEVFNVKLFLGEIITALKVQELGGKFILKIYDCSFLLTKQLLSLLCVFYQKVRIVKPVTSRPGNSQKYMLCQGFLGLSEEQEKSLKQLLKAWTQIQPNLSYFENKQFVTQILDFSNFSNLAQVNANLQKANGHFLQEQIDKLQEGLKLAEDNDNDGRQIEERLKQSRFKEQLGYAYKWCKKYNISHIQVKETEQTKVQPKKQEAAKEV